MSKKAKSEKKKKSGKSKALRLQQQADGTVLAGGDGVEAATRPRLAAALVQAARSVRTLQSRHLADCGLYAGQDGVILLLAAEDGLTAGQLAQRLGVKAPTMTRTIGRMEAQGFVERRGSDKDARLTRVFLSETGRATLARIEAAGAALEQQATRGMSGKDIKTLLKMLDLLHRNLHRDGADAVVEESDEI
ncbi:MarR family winged helix-turn-helix transcriptional regulator [Rhizobium paknamense]|uniref:DNA-binding MarR family transcriptional regulator n=1 Tax=Rhizobium paknamense TaxID=1206817 RepID=A0ABU0IDH8_9HYPH|nr:MarR family transcriptional regulator [Rhizobium paknamense]MDQ0456236.1 DNA-binding MarR family transcriptional regulator [Rhizobium paknamense]